MSYVDGMVCAVPTENKQAYVEHARKFSALLKEYGAANWLEAWGDDVPTGKVTDFHRAVEAKDGETIVFSWITWPDKETHATGWAKIMEDPRMAEMKMPFDGQRLIYGRFDAILEA